MKVSELQPRQGKVDIELTIKDKGQIRSFEKFGKQGRVCNATGTDGEGDIKLTLWNEQIDEVNVGDKVKIENGYVSEYQGEMQLSTGKFGKMTVTGKGDAPKTSSEDEEEDAGEDKESLDEDPEVEEEEI